VAQPDVTGTDWQLLAVDGKVVELDVTATLRIEADGQIGGQAPCNRWSARNGAALPALQLGAIRATRMACDRLAEEQAFFDTLAAMTDMREDGGRNLILAGSDGRTMEFVADRMNSLTRCLTCPPQD
jgi:heat shock protein HslJ